MSIRPPGDEPTFLYELEREGRDLELIEYLQRSQDPLIRYRTAEILGDFRARGTADANDRICRALLQAAKGDDHDAVRAAAIDALYLRDEERLEALIEDAAGGGVRDPPDWTGVDDLVDWLESDYPEFRLVAAAAVGLAGERRDASALVPAFTDGDIRVRREAVRAAGRLGSPRSVDPLANRLRDQYEGVRRAAAESLATIGTERALEALVPATRDGDESVRLIAVGALGRFGNERPIPVLLEALEDRSEKVARTATRSLLKLLSNAPSERTERLRDVLLDRLVDEADPAAVVPHLVTILNGNPGRSVRRHGTWLLDRLVTDAADADRDAAVDYLLESLGSDDDVVATLAMSTLVAVGGQGVARRVRTVVERAPSAEAADRAERVLERIDEDLRSPSESDAVEGIKFTYVEDPAEYTAQRRDREGNSN